jgi:hypothetical protein
VRAEFLSPAGRQGLPVSRVPNPTASKNRRDGWLGGLGPDALISYIMD